MKSTPVRLGRAIVLSILFFVTIFSLTGLERNPDSIWTAIHSWTGSLLLIGSTVHLLTNLGWIKTVFSKLDGALAKRARQNRRIDLGLFITGFICAVTAVLRLVDPVAMDSMNRLHAMSGLFMIVFLGIHLLLHWPWLVNTIRQLRASGSHPSIGIPVESAGK